LPRRRTRASPLSAPGIAEALAAAIPASIAYNRLGAALSRAGQKLGHLIEERAGTGEEAEIKEALHRAALRAMKRAKADAHARSRAAQARLRAQIAARLGQAPAGEFECRFGAQEVEVVGVLVAAGDGENASADHVSERVRDTRVGKTARQSVCDPQPPFGRASSIDAAIRTDPPAVESSCDFLASDGWK